MTCAQHVFCVPLAVWFVLSVSASRGAPSSMFQGTSYSGPLHRHRNKNWCAFIVQKNVSCAVQGNVESHVEPEVAPCPIHHPDCEQQMIYRTRFRPTYRISYKTVTELEWRCCPGYQGPDCKDPKGSPNTQTILEPQPQPHPQPRPGHTRTTQRPGRQQIWQYDGHRGAERTPQLEQEVQRLSQTVLDLQAAMTTINTNLRTDLQEDTSKMLVTLLNNMRPPDTARTGGTEESVVHLDGHQATRGRIHGERGMEEVLARLNDVTDALKSKDEAIEELRGAVTGHDGQIRMLMDTSQVPADTVGASTDLDVLQTYIDGKFEKLKKEMTVAMKDQIAQMRSECDDRIFSLQKTCDDGQKRSYASLTKLLESTEAELRKEIRELHLDLAMSDGLVSTNKQTPPIKEDDIHHELWQELQRVAEAHRILNARVDNELEHLSMLQLEDVFGPRLDELEAQMNVTERNAEAYCFYVDEKITKELADEIANIRQFLDDRLNSMEDQFTAMLIEMSNRSFPGMLSDSVDALQSQVNGNKYLIQGLEDKLNAMGQICSVECKTSSSNKHQNQRRLESIAKDLRHCMSDLDVLKSDVINHSTKLVDLEGKIDHLALQNQQNGVSTQDLDNKLKPLKDDVSGVTGAVVGLTDSVSKISRDLQTLNSTCCLAGQGEWAEAQPPHGDSRPRFGQVEELRVRLDKLSGQVTKELSLCKEAAANIAEGFSAVDGRVVTLEQLCGKQNEQINQVQGMKNGLERHLAQVNSSLLTHSREIDALQSNLLNFQNQLAALKGHTTKLQALFHKLNQIVGVPMKQEIPSAIPDYRTSSPSRRNNIPEIHIPLIIPHHPRAPVQPGRPRQQPSQPAVLRPPVETGEAGPPGYIRMVTVQRDEGLDGAGKPVKGFAGAPGHPPISPVAYRPGPVAVSQVLWNPAQRLFARPVSSERNLFADPFSFSAGLSKQMFSGDFGIIRFNRVLVNDGGHYNPQTGIFTAPLDGRYLVSGVLTAPHHARVEAVLSVSERSVLKLDSAGYMGASEPATGPSPGSCGGSASFTVIISLRAGDRVALVRTAGALAISEAREVLSTFSAMFLYPPQARR